MPAKIGCDAHKQFSVFVTIDDKGKTSQPVRVEHHRQHYIDFLHSLPSRSEIATCAIRLKAYRDCHVGLLYHRLAPNKGHGRAIVAVARHLSEASYWVLRKRQPYKSPAPRSNPGPSDTDAA